MGNDSLRARLHEFRLKLCGLEILLEAESGRRAEGWFTGVEPPHDVRGEATQRLVTRGLLERRPAPVHYALTAAGREVLSAVRARIGARGRVDWTRVDEIDF